MKQILLLIFLSFALCLSNACVSGRSEFNKCVSPEDNAKLSPVPPQTLSISQINGSVLLKWFGTNADHIIKYNIYKKSCGESAFRQIHSIEVTENNIDTVFKYLDGEIVEGCAYQYCITANCKYGFESRMGNKAKIKIK